MSRVHDSKACFQRQPVRAWRKLIQARLLLAEIDEGLARVKRNLARTDECIARREPDTEDLPEFLMESVDSFAFLANWVSEIGEEIAALEEQIFDGLLDGTIVPEPSTITFPRIVVVPRQPPVRAFLRVKPPRVSDRITVILLRRRRMPRPAALSVPPETDQGRAPPLSSVCPL